MSFLQPRSQRTTLDASGNGQVSFEIDNTNVRWIIDQVNVATSQPDNSIPVPRADVYLNQVAPQAWEGGTSSGNKDIATGRSILYAGDVLFVTWTGGRPGDTATAIIRGTFDPAGTPIRDG